MSVEQRVNVAPPFLDRDASKYSRRAELHKALMAGENVYRENPTLAIFAHGWYGRDADLSDRVVDLLLLVEQDPSHRHVSVFDMDTDRGRVRIHFVWHMGKMHVSMTPNPPKEPAKL